ncbi:ROK family transcriptional regulator [Sediminibacillus massiliensis]|uniref:ROK family transcriptional regulator n=1 Tax=Sediminibacillus massiliensis TaxID=1926277 RepID=UPI00098862A4|nr:ROK family transcriptional regulator [Sediminibacillus massiliensis]
MQHGSFQWMKFLNKSIILNKIRTDGPISRAQIAKDTKLTPPTVGSIVKELIDQQIVTESTLGSSQGGRKPKMLVINSSGFYVIGIDAGPRNIKFILSDLAGKVQEGHLISMEENMSNQTFIDILVHGVRKLLVDYSESEQQIVGIGVAMHGAVNVKEGISLYAPNLNLRNVAIKKELEKNFGYEVKVENDARAIALAESWFGSGAETKSMLALNLGSGIGAGLIIDGRLYHGEFDIAGEIGHMTIDLDGDICTCGNRGCLQTFASGPAIERKAEQAINQGKAPVLTRLIDGNIHQITGEMVYEAAISGDNDCRNILEEAGRYVGIGLTNLIHIINPGKIIIGGGVANAGEFLLEPIKATIAEKALTAEAKQTQVTVSELGGRATALGAVALLLTELFEPVKNDG